MKIKFDTHTHTLASTHAYSTVSENATYAAKIGMDGFAVTDHAPAMPDAPHDWHFRNLKNLPRNLYGQKILIGAELNILDPEGNVDLDDELLKRLDVVNASIHAQAYSKGDKEDCTCAYEAVVKNPLIDIICHSGTPEFSYDYEYIIKLAKANNKLMEINNHTFFVRKGSVSNCRKIAELCKKHGVGIVVSSDAHMFTDIGDYTHALQLLEDVDFPEELVMNTSYEKFAAYMKDARNKEMMSWKQEA
ncbi:MAG: phosphatase [Candidatus Ornithomonoglobus sp.]